MGMENGFGKCPFVSFARFYSNNRFDFPSLVGLDWRQDHQLEGFRIRKGHIEQRINPFIGETLSCGGACNQRAFGFVKWIRCPARLLDQFLFCGVKVGLGLKFVRFIFSCFLLLYRPQRIRSHV